MFTVYCIFLVILIVFGIAVIISKKGDKNVY